MKKKALGSNILHLAGNHIQEPLIMVTVFNVLNHSTGAAGVFGDCHLQKM